MNGQCLSGSIDFNQAGRCPIVPVLLSDQESCIRLQPSVDSAPKSERGILEDKAV
jgi:hypothetical protein